MSGAKGTDVARPGRRHARGDRGGARARGGARRPGLFPVLFDRWARAVDEASRLPAPRLLFEMAALDLCAAEPMVPLGDLLQRLDDMEGRLRGGAAGAGRPGAGARRRRRPRGGSRPNGTGGPAELAPPPSPRRRVAPAAAAAAPAAAAAAAPAAPAPEPAHRRAEAWRRVTAAFEAKGPRLAALLAHAEVVSLSPSEVTLAFENRRDAERAEKARAGDRAGASATLGPAAEGDVHRRRARRRPCCAPRSAPRPTPPTPTAEPRGGGPPAPRHPAGAGRVRRRAQGDQDTLAMSMPDLKGLLETAQRIQSEVARVREELARKTVEGETGRRPVPLHGQRPRRGPVAHDRPRRSRGDKKMIEDLAVGAINMALDARARAGRSRSVARDRRVAAAARAVRRLTDVRVAHRAARAAARQASRHRRKDRGAAGVPHPARLARGRGRAGRGDRGGQTEDPVLLGLLRPDRGRPLRHLPGRAPRRRPSSAWSRSPRTWSPSSGPGATAAGTTSSTASCRPSTASARTTCASPSWSRRCARARPTVRRGSVDSGGHPGDQPQRRRGGDRRLPGQAAPPAGRARHPDRHRRPDRRRAGVCRPGDAGAGHRRPP